MVEAFTSTVKNTLWTLGHTREFPGFFQFLRHNLNFSVKMRSRRSLDMYWKLSVSWEWILRVAFSRGYRLIFSQPQKALQLLDVFQRLALLTKKVVSLGYLIFLIGLLSSLGRIGQVQKMSLDFDDAIELERSHICLVLSKVLHTVISD